MREFFYALSNKYVLNLDRTGAYMENFRNTENFRSFTQSAIISSRILIYVGKTSQVNS